NSIPKTPDVKFTQMIASIFGLKHFPGFVHHRGIQATEFIIRYQINHSLYDNEIKDWGNIGILHPRVPPPSVS
ncbi:MAG: hypothetical protein P8165_15330, partial [Deltaproteobacteria bacterium]